MGSRLRNTTKQTFYFNQASDRYHHFRVVFPKVNAPLQGLTQIAEVELLGLPIDSSLDVISYIIKSVSGNAQFPVRREFTLRTRPGATYAFEFRTDLKN